MNDDSSIVTLMLKEKKEILQINKIEDGGDIA
jgi:hypothetical protein